MMKLLLACVMLLIGPVAAFAGPKEEALQVVEQLASGQVCFAIAPMPERPASATGLSAQDGSQSAPPDQV